MTDYTSPSTRSNNFLVDEDVYNDEIINNIKHLHEAINSIVVLEDQKASGTDAGTFTQGVWQTRTLNTKVLDVNSICVLSSNQFTLNAGTYEIEWRAPALSVRQHQSRLQNVTDGTTICYGSSAYADDVDSAAESITIQTDSTGKFRFTVAASKALEIQHQCTNTKATNGYGSATGYGGTEIYTRVFLRKVA